MSATGGYLIAGGGTAGHTNPGIAVAQALVAAGVAVERVHFVGGSRGNEGELVAEAGFTIDQLPGRGLTRSVTPEALRHNAEALASLAKAVHRARAVVRERRPRAVLCLGGYAAAPATLAAVTARVPVVVSEQNARASAVNRWASKFAAEVALPYPDTDLDGELTGNPIRREVVEATLRTSRADARSELGLDPDRVVIAVWGGSLGARSVNRATEELCAAWSDRSDVAVHHVVGRRDWAEAAYRDGGPPPAGDGRNLAVHAVEYEHRMPLVLAAADIAVCRAGASTCAELAVAGLPAVLIPLPNAPRDHQWANAEELVGVAGAVRLRDDELTGARLVEVLDGLVGDADRRRRMAAAARSVGRPDAAAAVAALLVRAGGNGGPDVDLRRDRGVAS